LAVRIGKTAENSLDYSLNNTARSMLWLPTSRRVKYVAKQAVDSFFARLGDVGSALFVFLLVGQLHLGVRGVAAMNVVFVLLWMYVAWQIANERERRAREHTEGRTEQETIA
jgi:AAA family ATP:ADP antiporter